MFMAHNISNLHSACLKVHRYFRSLNISSCLEGFLINLARQEALHIQKIA